jgi:hypothetical protein
MGLPNWVAGLGVQGLKRDRLYRVSSGVNHAIVDGQAPQGVEWVRVPQGRARLRIQGQDRACRHVQLAVVEHGLGGAAVIALAPLDLAGGGVEGADN